MGSNNHQAKDESGDMPIDLIINLTLQLIIFLSLNEVYAATPIKDYGSHGHTFPILEQSLIEVIIAKLNEAKEEGRLEILQENFTQKAMKSIQKPLLVAGLKKAITDRSWIYDPTLTQVTPIFDEEGRIIVAAGTVVNPLDHVSWGEPLILIDGEDIEQVNWAKKQKGKLTLVNGSPIALSKQLGVVVYFDQGGVFTKKFKIEAVPAIISQEGKKLKIEEMSIK